MSKSKWWLFREGESYKALTQIAVSDTKRGLNDKITEEIEVNHIRPAGLVRFYGRIVPIETKQIYR